MVSRSVIGAKVTLKAKDFGTSGGHFIVTIAAILWFKLHAELESSRECPAKTILARHHRQGGSRIFWEAFSVSG
jgi:hypothetical protein